jgi:DNA-binding IclR family transcriptional regulator
MRVVPALDRGLRILDLLAKRGESMRVPEIAEKLNLPRSATYELVHTLAVHQAVRQLPDGQVSLGQQVLVLGSAFGRTLDFGQAAQQAATELMRTCEETVQVGVLDGRHVLYLAKADSPRMVRLVSTVGARLPAHCTALGKLLLALLPEEELERRLDGMPLEQLTKDSIVDPQALRRELKEIRSNGFAREDGESNPEVSCVAAPVWDVHGQNIAAMSIAVPTTRMDAEHRERMLEAVLDGARKLSSLLGYIGSSHDR